MLLFKLLITPVLIGLIGIADRRWGSTVGGWLVGLPLTSAPVTAFVAIELGSGFARQMAVGILMGLISQALFCVAYTWLAQRVNWLASWLLGWMVFALSTSGLKLYTVALPIAFGAVISMLLLILWLWPPALDLPTSKSTPAWVLWGRMALGTSVVLLLSSSAQFLGPQLSGLLAPLPIFATVFAIFAHKLQGSQAAQTILHGVVVSSFACAVFFLVVSFGIERWGITLTFGSASIAAILTQAIALKSIKLVESQPAIN